MPKNAFVQSQEKSGSYSKNEGIEKLEGTVANRFGTLPNFFTLTRDNSEITECLWDFACFAYLNNPLPTLFKERLFIYLSRFCDGRCCISTHIGFLIGLGYPLADKQESVKTVESILQIIRRPFPLKEKIELHIEKLHGTPPALINWQSLDEELEEAIFSCATHVFLQTTSTLTCSEALKKIFDKSQFQYLLLFFTFIRSAHYWSTVQTDSYIEDNLKRLLEDYEELAKAIKDDSETKAFLTRQELLDKLNQFGEENTNYKYHLDRYEKLHQKDKEELSNARANLVERMADGIADVKLFQRSNNQLIENESVEKLYRQIIESAKTIMCSDAVSMQEYIPENNALHLLAWDGFHPSAAKFWEWVTTFHSSTCVMAMADHKRSIVPNVECCDFLYETDDLEYYRLCGIRSVQSTPLISRSGELVGIISNHWKRIHQPSEQDFAMLDVIIRQAADLLECIRAKVAFRENEYWLNGQKEAFQAAMRGLPLKVSLKALIDTFVTQTNGQARGAFYLVPPCGKGLDHIVGMPDDYAKEINILKIGPESLACDLAMSKGEKVITQDIEHEPLLKPWRTIARKHNYRSCWSFPVRTKGGPIIGTFAVYFSQPRNPGLRELELAAILTHAAAIIISRDRELLERTQAEKALRQSEKKLKSLVRLRDEFISNASHELNTPLTSLMVYTEMLEKNFKKFANSHQVEMMRKLKLQVDRLYMLIKGMLDTTRLAGKKLVLNTSFFDLNELLREKAEEFQNILHKHKIVMNLESIEKVVADKERIGQVINNLLSNAIKYSSRGGEITIFSKKEGNFVKVSIVDQGIGIPINDLEKIFERFYRVNSDKANTYPGMGIGLAICRDIIEMHKGIISVESTCEKGSNFTFIIPMKYI